jgi:DNA repair exonuclease SbcCD ATPase subunit
MALLQQQVLTLQADKNTLSSRVEAVETDRQAAEQEVESLKTQLVGLQQEKSATDARLAELEKVQTDFNDLRTSVQPLLNAAKPVTSLEGVTAEAATLLQKNRITTVKELADADTTRLRELGIDDSTATNLVKQANDQLLIK